MIADRENLLSDRGHHLLYCDCGACNRERRRKKCEQWFGRGREIPDDEFNRIDWQHKLNRERRMR